MDDLVGDVISTLRDNSVYENTIFVLIGDNGANENANFGGGSNDPLRGGKGNVYEGGTRTPAFIHSPLLRNGLGVTDSLVHIVDWLPTFLKAAGASDDDLRELDLDGIDQ